MAEANANQTHRRRAALHTFTGASATTFAAAAQALFLTPVALHQVGPNLYGAWLASADLLMWILAFDFGFPNFMIQRIGVAHASSDFKAVGAYFGTGLITLLPLVGVLAVVLVGVSFFVPAAMHTYGEDARTLSRCLAIAVVATCLTVLNYMFQGLARAIQDTAFVNVAGFVGVLAGFAGALIMLQGGLGLSAIAYGLLIRSGIAISGGLIFYFLRVAPEIRSSFKVKRELMPEYLRYSPPMFASAISNALMNDSHTAVAGLVMGPQWALVLGITRKLADFVSAFLDTVVYATYGGFAHLWGSSERDRARQVMTQIVSIFLGLGFAAMGCYIAFNHSFVSLWVGERLYGGPTLTVLLAFGLISGGWSYLMINLYRATGALMPGSAAMIIECAVRVPLMAGLCHFIGLVGIPIATVGTSLVTGTWAWLRLKGLFAETPKHRLNILPWLGRAAIIGAAVAICLTANGLTWPFFIALGSVFGVATVLVVRLTDTNWSGLSVIRIQAGRTGEAPV